MTPYLILGCPRSRTAWVSRFLTYRDWSCGHDEARHCRQLEDVKSWLSQPNTGTVETAAAPFWRLALHLRPDLRLITIRRDLDEAAASAVRCGLTADFEQTVKVMRRLDHKLGQIERRVPGVRSFRFEDLVREDVCADLFEHCLPYKHDHDRWSHLTLANVQINVPELFRYIVAHRPQMDRLAGIAKQKSLALLSARKARDKDGLTIQCEPLADLLRDGAALFRQHCAEVGEYPEAFEGKNLPLLQRLEDIGCLQVVTARSNGKTFGYLLTVLSPSLESQDRLSACHTAFYASPDYPGLGLKLQRAAVERLTERGVGEVLLGARGRGAGERLSALYRRLGAEPFAQYYKLDLEGIS